MSSAISFPVARFSRWSVVLHWLSVIAVVSALVLGLLRSWLEDSGWDEQALAAHRQLGLLVLVLWGARLLARWRASGTTAAPDLPRMLLVMAGLSHLALYGLLLAMPVLGWAMTNAQGHAVLGFGILPLPNLLSVNPDWADSLQEWHEMAAYALIGLVLLHVAAALFHHWVLKDEVLRSMLPGLKRRG